MNSKHLLESFIRKSLKEIHFLDSGELDQEAEEHFPIAEKINRFFPNGTNEYDGQNVLLNRQQDVVTVEELPAIARNEEAVREEMHRLAKVMKNYIGPAGARYVSNRDSLIKMLSLPHDAQYHDPNNTYETIPLFPAPLLGTLQMAYNQFVPRRDHLVK
jgi:hypothetical protein